jgi:hypothetical protein
MQTKFSRKPKGKRQLGRPRFRRDENNKMILKERRCGLYSYVLALGSCEYGDDL